MDTHRWRASEVALILSMTRERKLKPGVAMQDALRSAGEGLFYLPAGHEAEVRLKCARTRMPTSSAISLTCRPHGQRRLR